MRVIALAGPKGSGKNTVADMIADMIAASTCYRQIAFADPLRAAAKALGVPWAELTDGKDRPSSVLGGATGRDLLVALGEAVRRVTPNFWADALARRLARGFGVIIVTDVRRANELDALEAWERSGEGCHLARVWIERPGHSADEVLEPALRERCAVIRNAGSLADLRAQANKLAAWAKGESACLRGQQGPQ